MKIRAFITHKPGEKYSDCQDRFCINQNNNTIAVSDGMTQSIFSEYWAEILSAQYAENAVCADNDRVKLCDIWRQKVDRYIEEQNKKGHNPWRLINNIENGIGAGATLCGVKFLDADCWEGDVLGDTCIIEVDLKTNTAKILSSQERGFDSYPDYYDSIKEKCGRGTIRQFKGNIDETHLLLIVSDPFSAFFDKYKDNCGEFVNQVLELKTHEDYCSLVDAWRAKGMHEDDSTLCIIEFDGEIVFNVVCKDDIDELIKKEELDIQAEQNL